MRNLLIAFSLILFIAESALAHSGRTNSSGCHNNRKTGGYHCHNGGYSRGKSRSYQKKFYTKYDKTLILQIQQNLNRLGYNAGTEDGVFGRGTEKSIKKFQKENKRLELGIPSQYLLDDLKEKVNK